jgi:hypothetical protein
MDPHAVALWCALPLAVGVSIDALELLVDRAQLDEGGVYGYFVLATGRPVLLSGSLAPLFAAIFRYPNVLGLVIAQLGAAAVLFAAGTIRSAELIVPAGLAVLVILGARMLLYLRSNFGLDGCDQMILVVCSGLGVALLIPGRVAQTIALDYIAAQLLLSYAVAGVAKAVSPVWRSGRAITGIMSTVDFGVPRFGTFLRNNPILARALCWSVIGFECGAAVAIVAGTPGAIVIIACGLLFHISVALFMGLNLFPWVFAATYPALLLLAHSVGTLWR